jgi:16S rRNA (guanine527-N7)-methyltransferase
METFVRWTHGKIKKDGIHELHNGILYLKGGDLNEELAGFPQARLFPLSDYFDDPFFDTKYVVHLPLTI